MPDKCDIKKPEPEAEDMQTFYRRIDRESAKADALKKERAAYVQREMARVHKPGDGCIENE